MGEKSEEQVITEVVAPRVERFDLAEAKAEHGLLSLDDHERFLHEWNRMDLSHVHGFPLWEKAVFRTLHSSFSGIRSLFNQYAKHSGGAVSSKSLQQTELVNMALDCCLATTAFPMARVQAVFTLADLKDDGKAGDMALELHEFLEAVVQLAFSRANPRRGEDERVAPAHPLPDCLDAILQKNLLKRAKLDSLIKIKKMVSKEPAVLASLKPLRPKLKRRFTQLATPSKTAPRELSMSQDAFCTDLFDRGVTKEITLRPKAAVKGALLPEVHSSLSFLDTQGAFATCQQDGEDDDALTMDFDEYVMALVLCGHMKYEEVEGMTLAQRVAGVVANLLGEKSEEQVITEVVVARVERFDAWTTARDEGVPDAFVELWHRLDLSGIYGFPLWERALFFTLLRSLSEVCDSVMTHSLPHLLPHTYTSAHLLPRTHLVPTHLVPTHLVPTRLVHSGPRHLQAVL